MHIPILIFISPCNEFQIPDSTHVRYDYYRVKAGQYRIHEVGEILFQIVGFDIKNYRISETICDSFWSFPQSPTYLTINENGTPITKPTFSVYAGNHWYGNALNTRSELTYCYQNPSNAVIDTLSPSDHIRVVIKDIEANFIGVDLKSEVYVLGVGLVEKDYLTQTNYSASDCGEELGQVNAGRSSRKKLIDVGSE